MTPNNDVERRTGCGTTRDDKLSQERQDSMSFKNGRPRSRWLYIFCSRHSDVLKFSHSEVQEGKRFNASNTETFVQHFSALEALYREYRIDARRAWNLHEAGCTNCCTAKGATKHKRFLRRNGYTNFKFQSSFGLMLDTFVLRYIN